MSDALKIERIPPGPEREALLPLLLQADEPEPLRGYLQLGQIYVFRDAGGDVLGATVVIMEADGPGTAELKNVAIAADRHNQGLGRRMLAEVLNDLRGRGVRRVIVGTSNAGIGEIAFYQKCGFRLWRIERDVFTPERGYDPKVLESGLAHRDMVWFDQDL
jgi:ribosomal protein S18 acetylase RimI-like enzyme